MIKRLIEKRVRERVACYADYGPGWGVEREGVAVQKRFKFPLLFICFAMFGSLFGCHLPHFGN